MDNQRVEADAKEALELAHRLDATARGILAVLIQKGVLTNSEAGQVLNEAAAMGRRTVKR